MNPFNRREMKILTPIILLEKSYEAWSDTHHLRYAIDRGANTEELIHERFRPGSIIEVDKTNLIVVAASLHHDMEHSGFKRELHVSAQTTEAVLRSAAARAAKMAPAEKIDVAATLSQVGQPNRRKILL